MPAELVRPCPEEPQVPSANADDKTWATYISNVIDAGAECRSQSAAQTLWIESAPK